MDAQLKRGLLENCVLKVLDKEPSYGYKLVKEISPYMPISESTLYPILRRLESADMLIAYSAEHNGRLRRYYRINARGRKRIKDFLCEWGAVHFWLCCCFLCGCRCFSLCLGWC